MIFKVGAISVREVPCGVAAYGIPAKVRYTVKESLAKKKERWKRSETGFPH